MLTVAVNVVNRLHVKALMKQHPELAGALARWWKVAKAAEWSNLFECREIFAKADQVGRVLIFDFSGYRLITVVSWRSRSLYVKGLLTHREYERNQWHKWAF